MAEDAAFWGRELGGSGKGKGGSKGSSSGKGKGGSSSGKGKGGSSSGKGKGGSSSGKVRLSVSVLIFMSPPVTKLTSHISKPLHLKYRARAA